MSDLERLVALIASLADLAYEALDTPTGDPDQQEEVRSQLAGVLGQLAETGYYDDGTDEQQSPSVTVEWGVQVPFAGNMANVLKVPDERAARDGAPLLTSEALPAHVVSRTVSGWERA